MGSMSAIFALVAALLWGGGDFSGGMAVRRVGGTLGQALRVVLLSHATSFCALIAIAAIHGDAFPHGTPMAWGIFGGMVGGTAITLFYVALSRGAMGTAATVSGLLAAAIPSVVSLGVDGAPGWRRAIGFCAAGLAIWLIADSPKTDDTNAARRTHRGTMGLAVASGAGFGVYFVALKYASAAGLVWPMATARIGSLSLGSAILLGLMTRRLKMGEDSSAPFPWKGIVAWVLGSAAMDTGGNMFYMAATRSGRLDVASVLASLYPATTILMAAWMLKEAPTRRQGFGMGVAVAAVLLITL